MAQIKKLLSELPVGRDIYTSRELAAHVFDVPVSEVTIYLMRLVRYGAKNVGTAWLLNGGAPVRWPTTGNLERVYAVRNAEKYDTLDKIVEHLQGVPHPGKSEFSNQLKEARVRNQARKAAQAAERERVFGVYFSKSRS